MDMCKEVIIVASAYDEKYYFNNQFDKLPKAVKEDLIKIAVTFVDDVGGIFEIGFKEDSEIYLKVEAAEEDLLYDHIGSELNIRRIQKDYRELFNSLKIWHQYYKNKCN